MVEQLHEPGRRAACAHEARRRVPHPSGDLAVAGPARERHRRPDRTTADPRRTGVPRATVRAPPPGWPSPAAPLPATPGLPGRGASSIALGAAILMRSPSRSTDGFSVALGTLSVLARHVSRREETRSAPHSAPRSGSRGRPRLRRHRNRHHGPVSAHRRRALRRGLRAQVFGFVAGQVAFTIAIVSSVNIIEPEGWRTGLTRIEDVALSGSDQPGGRVRLLAAAQACGSSGPGSRRRSPRSVRRWWTSSPRSAPGPTGHRTGWTRRRATSTGARQLPGVRRRDAPRSRTAGSVGPRASRSPAISGAGWCSRCPPATASPRWPTSPRSARSPPRPRPWPPRSPVPPRPSGPADSSAPRSTVDAVSATVTPPVLAAFGRAVGMEDARAVFGVAWVRDWLLESAALSDEVADS